VHATSFSEDLQHCAFLERALTQAGHATVMGSPAHLTWRRGPLFRGRRVQGLFRFYPGEWMTLLPDAQGWRRALGVARMMSPFCRLLTQSKRCFAFWQNGSRLERAERELVARHCPSTECFDPSQVDRYRRDRAGLVLKRAFGRMGDAVLLGDLTQPAEWERALGYAAAHARDFAVQERFRVKPLGFGAGRMYPTVGAYAVNGTFAGYYSRVAAEPFITHEAYHVATVVESA
jgi:Glutathionylspermidine synthase preATP-grasp